MAIHHVNVKPETTATLLEAAEQARMTLLDFETFVLRDWAERYEQHKRGLAELTSKLEATMNKTQ
ncbi:MAG: hypothetical protein IPM41_06485 [Sphingomonadales bacterium]|jgi:hypothetical protein|nr:hypothetical protein [Sphingomonadales bacterium]